MLTRHNDPVLGASGWRPISASRSSTDPTETASWAPAAARKLHTQSVAVVVITITPVNCIISVPVKAKMLQFKHYIKGRAVHMQRKCSRTRSAMLAASLIWSSLLIRLAVLHATRDIWLDIENIIWF